MAGSALAGSSCGPVESSWVRPAGPADEGPAQLYHQDPPVSLSALATASSSLALWTARPKRPSTVGAGVALCVDVGLAAGVAVSAGVGLGAGVAARSSGARR